MDREQEEMQFLGLFGIYLESYKIIISCRKLFSQITLALILPLSFIFFARIEVRKLLLPEIVSSYLELLRAPLSIIDHNNINDLIFKFFYLTFSLVFSLLSTSAVVYTIASIYTAREVNFSKVMSVVPKVWKRLMVTYLCAFVAFFLYNVVSVIIVFLWGVTIGSTALAVPTLLSVLISYFVGFVYFAVLWLLASVLSVQEDYYGFKAMMRSKDLMKGKTWIMMIIGLKLVLSITFIVSLFEDLVMHGRSHSLIIRIGLGFLGLLVLCKLLLFALVVHTVIYFVCKSYHHENIDKSILSGHLDVYLGDYIPLKAKDVQLEQLHT